MLKKRISASAKMAKWKIDQQLKINKAQSELQEIRTHIVQEKIKLADVTFESYIKKRIEKKTPVGMQCETLTRVMQGYSKKESEVEKLKEEQPPDFSTIELIREAETTSKRASRGSKKICTSCGSSVPARFCPNCGLDTKGAKNG